MKKKILNLTLLIMLLFISASCGKKDLSNGTIDNVTYKEVEEKTNYVKIEMKDDSIIIVELYPDIAPITVENFQKLVSEKYYDNIIFHRVIKDFMIQGGDPTGSGMGDGSAEPIKGEFEINGIENNLLHTKGVISMARRGGDPETEDTMNSASSQFFIMHADYPALNGKYAAFGKVVAGLDVVDNIALTPVDANDKPLRNKTIRSIRFVSVDIIMKTVEK